MTRDSGIAATAIVVLMGLAGAAGGAALAGQTNATTLGRRAVPDPGGSAGRRAV